MTELEQARLNTAGAYIIIDGDYLFAIGIRPHQGHIPVVRLGGHREAGETGWQCAEREVYEESGLRLKPLLPRTTYFVEGDHPESELQEINWQSKSKKEPPPILVILYRHDDDLHLSLMYLAHGEGCPSPSSEVKGLLFLKEEEVHRLCRTPVTLEHYLNWGGRAILNAKFDTSLLLEPFAQLRLLSNILSLELLL